MIQQRRLPAATAFRHQGRRAVVSQVRRLIPDHSRLTDVQLQSAANDLRESLYTQKEPVETLQAKSFALSFEAIRRTIGAELFDVQLMASAALANGRVAEMATGEGKTLAAIPAAMYGALCGQSVHVATPNAYLAERDYSQLRSAFEFLGITVGLLPEGVADNHQKKLAYDSEVTYGTGYEFGFDFLRDQLACRSTKRRPLGQSFLDRLHGVDQPTQTRQRGRMLAIVDEVDNVLLDDAGSPLILSDRPTTSADDSDACRLAGQTVSTMRHAEHYRISVNGAIEITPCGIEKIYDPMIAIPVKQLRRPWTEYVEQAIRAEFLFHRDANYLVVDGQIQIVDGSTGRVFSDRSWTDGLHQAIEAKEGLVISSERSALAQITRQRYFRLYSGLCGMTGTAVGCESEFRTVYRMHVNEIPRRLPCQRTMFPMRTFANDSAKWKAVVAETKSQHDAGRPVLIGTRTISESETIADLLRQQKLPFQLLNGKQDAEEADIISKAGCHGEITIATDLAGRGTDIKLDDSAKERGGLHVIVSSPYELVRSERQLIGRCARQGDPGSARRFVSADDGFMRQHAPWLIPPILRCADARGEVSVDLGRRIHRVQRILEQERSASRIALMKNDLARDSLLNA